MGFNVDVLFEMISELLPYIKNTLFITFVSFLLAMTLAIIISGIVYFQVPILYRISKVYISFFMSTPVISQIFVFFYGLPQLIPSLKGMSPMVTLIAVLGISQSSFLAETLRGSLSSVDKIQYEAALVVGMTNSQAMRRIMFPQAFRVAFPGLCNTLVGLIKGTSIGFTVGVVELMSKAKIIGMNNYRLMESYVAVLLLYWGIVLVIERLQKGVEKKLGRAY